MWYRCSSFSPRFGSTLPARLGLPPLDADSNLAEGIVVRAAREPLSAPRRMFKVKIPEFAETRYVHDDWRSARAGGCDAGGGPSFSERAAHLRWEALAAVTEQRLASVISKVGCVDAADRAACRRLLQLFVEDVEAELVEEALVEAPGALRTEHPEVYHALERASRPLVAAHLRRRG